jgi:hypothetical protein
MSIIKIVLYSMVAMVATCVLLVLLAGCSYAPQEYLGRQLSGLDCRQEKLDAKGRCVAAR